KCAPQSILTARLGGTGRELGGKFVEARLVGSLEAVERVAEADEGGRKLAKDLEIARSNLLADAANDAARLIEQVGLGGRCAPEDALQYPVDARLQAVLYFQERAHGLRHVLVADEVARGLGGPGGVAAPVRVGHADYAADLLRELVVALRNPKITQCAVVHRA